MSGFFQELQRRKVYRVAAAYIVAAGFLIQIASAAFPAWELLNWSLRLVIALLLIGFPIALLLAWAYDVTPQGIQATARVPAAHRRRNLILLVVAGAIISTAAGFFLLPRASARKIDKSVAVLPFQNLSDEKANAYFAEGIQNEILTKLAAIRNLKVISRTSTAKYQSKPDDLKTVAQELGVSTILEGAVQRAGDKVRVNVQLIDARADTHLWAKSYDRDFKDVLAVESEVSQEIADALRANLSPSESHVLSSVRTHDTEAYDLFLRGEYEFHQAESSLAADTYDRADARAYCAWVYRRRGEWERSLTDSKRAEELDPRDARIPTNIGVTYNVLRLWKDAERAELRALAIDPHNTLAALFLLGTRLNATGDVDSARRPLDGFPEVIKGIPGGAGGPRGATGAGDVSAVIGWPVYLDVIERRFTDALQAVEKEVVNGDRAHLQQLAGRVAVRVLAGEPEAGKSAGEDALPLLEARLRERPDDTLAMTELSWVYLALGRNGDALRLSRQAADSISIEKDALAGPNFQDGLAQIEARAGAPEEAIRRLRRLLSIPAGGVASIARLKVDPVWDPIRNRSDFQQLLSGPEQIGPNK